MSRKLILSKKELIEKYNLNEEEQVYLLPILMDIEDAVRRHITSPV